MTDIINIGDGRYVHKTEDGVFRPLPPPKPKWRQHNHHNYDPSRGHVPPEYTPSHKRPNRKNMVAVYSELMVGYKEYLAYSRDIGKKYGNVGREVGHAWGYRKRKLAFAKRAAKKQVKKDMANIKKSVELDPMAEEALEGALSVLRMPNNQSSKLSAAKLILEFTKSKPVAKSEVSVNKAEEWLASLAHDIEE